MEIKNELISNKSKILPFLEIIFISIFIVFFLRITTLEFYRISSDSMIYSLQTGDYIVISKIHYSLGISPCLPVFNIRIPENWRIKLREIQRGDLVVFFCQIQLAAERDILKE